MIFKYDEKTDIHHYYIIDLPMLGIRLQQRYYRKAPLSGKRTGFQPRCWKEILYSVSRDRTPG